VRAVRRIALGFVAALVALLLPWASSPAQAFVPPPVPSPVTLVKTLLGYSAVDAGALAAGGACVGCDLAVAGYGSYEGTCWAFGKLVSFFGDEGSCDVGSGGGRNILSWTWDKVTGDSPANMDKWTGGTANGTPGGYCCFAETAAVALVTTCRSADGAHTTTMVTAVGRQTDGPYNGMTTGAGDCAWTAGGGNAAYSSWSSLNPTIGGVPVKYGYGPDGTTHNMAGDPCNAGGAWAPCVAIAQKVQQGGNAWNGTTMVAQAPGAQVAYWRGAGAGTSNTLTFTETCMAPSGATATASVVGTGSGGPNTTISPTVALPSCESVLPGSKLQKIGVTGGHMGLPNEIDKSITLFTPTAAAAYPQCTTGAGCYLDLRKNGQSCFTKPMGVVYCADWQHNSADTFTCWYGPYKLSTSACIPDYGTSFDFERQLDPNQQPYPNGSPGPGPGTTTAPSPSVSPSTGTNPTTGPVPWPIDPETGRPIVPDPESANCWGEGWSWNPVSWVYIPVKCSLVWAFVPTAPPSFADIPSPLPTGWVPTFPALGDGSCGTLTMPSLNLGPMQHATGSHELLNTCDAPWPLVRSFTYYGLLAGALVTVGNRAFRAVMTSLGMSVDTPASGGDE
jgi:hypothetical protein